MADMGTKEASEKMGRFTRNGSKMVSSRKNITETHARQKRITLAY